MKGTNKISLCIYVALLIAFCIITVNSQRGGSRSSSSSSSSSRSSRSHYRSSTTSYPKNCTTVDGVTTCVTTDDELSIPTLIIFAGIFVAFIGFAIYSSSKD